MEVDIRKKLQDKANEIIKSAIDNSGIQINYELKELLTGIVVMSLKQGYIWGVSSVKQTAEYMLNNIKGIN